MIRLTRTHVQPIGLDIGHDSIKMLQLERRGDVSAVTAAAKQLLGPEVAADPQLRMPVAIELIGKMLRQHPFHGKRVVAAVPREVVHLKNLRLPPIPAAELPAVVQFEAKNILSFDPAQGQVNFLTAGEVRQGTETRQEVIIVAARDEDVTNHLESLFRAGLTVASLDVEPCALYRSIERFIRRRQDEQEVNVIVDVGCRRSQVVIGRGREISFVKPIDIGGRHLTAAVARKLGVSEEEAQSLRHRLSETTELKEGEEGRDTVRQAAFDATRSIMEELCREISLCLRYYSVTFRGQRPTRVRLMGGEAADPQLQQICASALPIPVEAYRPMSGIDTSRMKISDRRGTMSEWSLALGLGLRMLQGSVAARQEPERAGEAAADAPRTPISGAEVIDLAQAVQAADVPSETAPAGRPLEQSHA